MKKKSDNNKNSKNFLIWVAIFGAFLVISSLINQSSSQKNQIDFSDFL
ncbi:MAG: hypothetical protein ISP24_03400, partial [Rickettsiales bacterium]|nr:hypothetical protein [Rickettsiales bacterium]